MATMTYNHGGRVLEISTEQIRIDTMAPEPDPFWASTDAAGHEHFASLAREDMITYPTLKTVTGEADWCEDCEEPHTDSWFVCRQCGEKIWPGTRTPSSPRYIPGRTEYLIDGEPVSEDEARAFVTAYQRALNHRQKDHRS